MTEMIERVERAIAQCLNEPGQCSYRDIAHAAIEAMREPSDAMVDAAWASWEDPEVSKGLVGVWQAMIDEALKEKP